MKAKALIVIVTLAVSLPAAAWPTVSFNVTPIRAEHKAKAGDTLTDLIELTNTGDVPARMKVFIEDWSMGEKGELRFTKPSGNPYSLAPWTRVNPVDFRLNPGQSKYVRYSIKVPPNTPSRGYRAAISFSTVPFVKPGEKVKKVFVRGKINVIIYTTVGRPQISGDLIGMSARPYEEGLLVAIKLRNDGEVHFRVEGELKILDGRGSTVARKGVPNIPVLPKSDREVEIRLPGEFGKGSYTVETRIDIGRRELLVGETTYIKE